jgi:hypothetical protein
VLKYNIKINFTGNLRNGESIFFLPSNGSDIELCKVLTGYQDITRIFSRDCTPPSYAELKISLFPTTRSGLSPNAAECISFQVSIADICSM